MSFLCSFISCAEISLPDEKDARFSDVQFRTEHKPVLSTVLTSGDITLHVAHCPYSTWYLVFDLDHESSRISNLLEVQRTHNAQG